MEKKYGRVCYVTTIYSLFLYLIHSTFEEINKTLFLIPPDFPDGITNHLPSSLFIKPFFMPKTKFESFLNKHFTWIYYALKRNELYKDVKKNAKLYFQDHLFLSEGIIGWKHYTLIEDSAQSFSAISKSKFHQRFWIGKKLTLYPIYKLLYGPVLYGAFARNNRCHELLLSVEDNDEVTAHIPRIICRIEDEWKKSSIEKQKLIKDIYNFTEEDEILLENCEGILYTQNFYSYNYLTKDEQIQLYREIIDQYPRMKLVIKPHPMDKIQYENYIPNINVYRKNIPSQLLDLSGIRFKRHITCYSSAVRGITYPSEIDWYGTEVSPKLFKRIGHKIDAPVGYNNCKIERNGS